ncbi:MAG: hypothetical protein ABIG20_01885 [archaeon]
MANYSGNSFDSRAFFGKGASLSESVKEFATALRAIGKVGTLLGILLLIGGVSLLLGNTIIAIACLFYIIDIPLRILDTSTDALFVESIGTFGLLLFLMGSPGLAAFYMFTSPWITRFVSPMGPAEDIGDTLSMSVAFSLAVLLMPWLVGFTHGNLLMLMIYYNLARFLIYYIVIVFVLPGVWLTYWFSSVIVVFTVMIQSYVILMLIGMRVLAYSGIGGWSLGCLGKLCF